VSQINCHRSTGSHMNTKPSYSSSLSCEDRTLASLWKRSESFSPTSYEAPFSKLTLSKLLVLKDKNTRDDYFAQQAAFVMLEGRKDVHAVSELVCINNNVIQICCS
jgi:hypothetical protein